MDALLRYLSALRLYGADVLLLALGVTLVTSLLKKTVLKNASRKIFVFLPYLLGLLLYCAYRMITTQSASPVTQDFLATAEGGFAVGCAATLYYVVYEQFFRAKKDTVNALTPLLEGIVPDENVAEVSQLLLEIGADKDRTEAAELVKETLSRYDCPLGDLQREVYCTLVASYLCSLKKE